MHKIEIETLVTRKNSQFHAYMPNVTIDLDDKDTVFTVGAIWNKWIDTLQEFLYENPGDGTASDDAGADVMILGVTSESPKYVIDVIRQFVSSLISHGYSVKTYGPHKFLRPAVYVGLSYYGRSIDEVYVVRPWSLDDKALFEAITDSCITSVRNYSSYEIDWLWGRYNRAIEHDYDYETIADKVVSMIKKEIEVNE